MFHRWQAVNGRPAWGQGVCTEKKCFTQHVAPSIESLLKLAPEDPESWVLGSNPKVNRIARMWSALRMSNAPCSSAAKRAPAKNCGPACCTAWDPRRDKPFVPVNCAALTATLAESQLFGHEKGAFTGAAGRSLGVFRAAKAASSSSTKSAKCRSSCSRNCCASCSSTKSRRSARRCR